MQKVVGGDRLDHQRIPVDLILSILANEGESSSSTMAMWKMEPLNPCPVRGPPQASKGIPCGLLHNEAAGDIGGLHQNEGVSILPGWSSERLAVSLASVFQHLGRHEAHIPGEVLSIIQNYVHQEGNMWDKATYMRNSA
ncbi:hypothetical protein CR513_14004, partial [Mucuna pruriens]